MEFCRFFWEVDGPIMFWILCILDISRLTSSVSQVCCRILTGLFCLSSKEYHPRFIFFTFVISISFNVSSWSFTLNLIIAVCKSFLSYVFCWRCALFVLVIGSTCVLSPFLSFLQWSIRFPFLDHLHWYNIFRVFGLSVCSRNFILYSLSYYSIYQ